MTSARPLLLRDGHLLVLLLLVIAAMLATGGVVEPALLVLVAGLLVPGRAARCRGRSELLERDSGPSRPAVER